MYIYASLIFLFVINVNSAFGQLVESESRWERFLENFYSKPDDVKNQTLVSAFYGRSFAGIERNSLRTTFSDIHNLDFYYGFIRIDERNDFDNVFTHQGEFAFLSNISTNFKTFKYQINGVVTDSWRFGFGLQDGFGFKMNKNNLYLNHASAFTWIRNDFDYFPKDSMDSDYINRFDEHFKFGMFYQMGVKYQLISIFNIELNYEHSFYYPQYEFFPWLASWLTDNILQRGPELFERELIYSLEGNYPFLKIVYKSLISLLLGELRRSNGFFPISSEKTLNYDTFKIGIVIII